MLPHPERMPERDTAILATAANVAFDGWTKRALRAGVADAGMPADEADLLFPLGTVDMIETFCDLADRRMEAAATALPEIALPGTPLPKRVRAVIALRLDQNRPYKEAIRRGLAVLALPQNAYAAATSSARTIDAIWHAAGDRSADFSWYTKRAILTPRSTAPPCCSGCATSLRMTPPPSPSSTGAPRRPRPGPPPHRARRGPRLQPARPPPPRHQPLPNVTGSW